MSPADFISKKYDIVVLGGGGPLPLMISRYKRLYLEKASMKAKK